MKKILEEIGCHTCRHKVYDDFDLWGKGSCDTDLMHCLYKPNQMKNPSYYQCLNLNWNVYNETCSYNLWEPKHHPNNYLEEELFDI